MLSWMKISSLREHQRYCPWRLKGVLNAKYIQESFSPGSISLFEILYFQKPLTVYTCSTDSDGQDTQGVQWMNSSQILSLQQIRAYRKTVEYPSW